jgi:enamine deaminase RidA (YjgF/YER057c/UK114 family)
MEKLFSLATHVRRLKRCVGITIPIRTMDSACHVQSRTSSLQWVSLARLSSSTLEAGASWSALRSQIAAGAEAAEGAVVGAAQEQARVALQRVATLKGEAEGLSTSTPAGIQAAVEVVEAAQTPNHRQEVVQRLVPPAKAVPQARARRLESSRQ